MVALWNHRIYNVDMANVTIKDLNDDDLNAVSQAATVAGMSTQEYLRRMIAREARRPAVPDQLAEIARRRRAGRKPMSMEEFNVARRAALRG
jgi:hypothetical protein